MMSGGVDGLESEPTVKKTKNKTKTKKQKTKDKKQNKKTKKQTNKTTLISVNEPRSARDLDNLR